MGARVRWIGRDQDILPPRAAPREGAPDGGSPPSVPRDGCGEPSGSGRRRPSAHAPPSSASPGAHGRSDALLRTRMSEMDPRTHGGAVVQTARPDAWSRSRAGACPIPLRPVGRDRAQRGQEDRGPAPGRAGLPGSDPVARGRDRPSARPPAPSRSDRDRKREPHRRRAPDGAGIRDRLQVDRHAAEPGPGDAIAGDAHPGAVDGGPVPLLPQPDDPGHHPGLPGYGDRRADDRWHPLWSSPWPPPCCSISSASRRGSWPSGSARRISPIQRTRETPFIIPRASRSSRPSARACRERAPPSDLARRPHPGRPRTRYP